MRASADKPVILIAEDQASLRSLVCRVLRRNNYRLLVATNAEEALQQSQAYHGTIHLLLSDVEMPGQDGITLAHAILRQRPEARILLMSGNITSIRQLEYDWEFLPKPFVPERLLEKVSGILNTPIRRR